MDFNKVCVKHEAKSVEYEGNKEVNYKGECSSHIEQNVRILSRNILGCRVIDGKSLVWLCGCLETREGYIDALTKRIVRSLWV
jgi:hypothetical protein